MPWRSGTWLRVEQLEHRQRYRVNMSSNHPETENVSTRIKKHGNKQICTVCIYGCCLHNFSQNPIKTKRSSEKESSDSIVKSLHHELLQSLSGFVFSFVSSLFLSVFKPWSSSKHNVTGGQFAGLTLIFYYSQAENYTFNLRVFM